MNRTQAPSGERHVHGLEDARLTALLRRARARLGLARMIETLSLGVPTVVATLVAVSWLVGRAESLIAGAGVVALTVVGVVAWLGTPHAARVAALLDERLRLADRVGTALRVGARTDAVAALIRHDALTHLTPSGLEGAFPLRIHRRTWLACAAVVISAGLWLLERPTLENAATPSSAGGGIAVRTSSGAGSGAAARGPAPTSPENNRAPGQPPPAGGADAQTPPATRVAESSEGPRDGGAPADAATARTPADRSALGRGAGEGDATSSRSRQGGSRDGSPGRGAAAGESSEVREAAARGAAGTAATAGGGAAGGVQYGQRLDGPATVARDAAGPALSAAAIRQGRLRAETAIAHDDVPPRYRAYLRDYFRTVQSTSEP